MCLKEFSIDTREIKSNLTFLAKKQNKKQADKRKLRKNRQVES